MIASHSVRNVPLYLYTHTERPAGDPFCSRFTVFTVNSPCDSLPLTLTLDLPSRPLRPPLPLPSRRCRNPNAEIDAMSMSVTMPPHPRRLDFFRRGTGEPGTDGKG